MKQNILTLLLIISAICGFSQGPQIRASINTNNIYANAPFQITYSVSGGNVQSFQPPSFKGLSVVGQNQFNQTSITNGVMTQEIKFIYNLVASSAGKYSIEPARAKVNGTQVQSQQVQFEVAASRQQARQNNGSGNSNNSPSGNTDNAQDLFIRAIPNKTTATVGEQLILTYKLYTRLSVAQYAIEKAPSNKGFWSQNLMKDNQQPKQYEETINGQRYIVAEIRKVSLVPQQSGKLTIEPLKVECLVKQKVKSNRGGGFFDDFFNDPFFDNAFSSTQTVKKNVSSNAVTLNISALPTKNQPADFTGAVGNFQISSTLDKSKVNINDAITLKIKISGKGNLQLIDNPKFTFPSDFETYDPKTSEQISTTENGMSGSKTYEYVLIPRAAGKFTIPSYSLSYYDLTSKQYKTISTDVFNIEVNKGSNSTSSTATVVSTNQKDIKYLGSDIRFIKTNTTNLRIANNYFFLSLNFWLLLLLPIILFFVIVVLLRKRIIAQSNQSLMKNKKATKVANKRLALAEKHLKENNSNSFYIEISKALWGYISDKFNISQSQLSLENVNETLKDTNTSEETVNDIIQLLNEIEFARFSPSENNQAENLFKQSMELILRIEKELK